MTGNVLLTFHATHRSMCVLSTEAAWTWLAGINQYKQVKSFTIVTAYMTVEPLFLYILLFLNLVIVMFKMLLVQADILAY